MIEEDKLRRLTNKTFQKKVVQINERIYHFVGYGYNNVTIIIGNTSVILVDALDSDIHASRLKKEIETITNKPIRTIIYSYNYPSYSVRVGVFKDTVQEVITFASMNNQLTGENMICKTTHIYERIIDGIKIKMVSAVGQLNNPMYLWLEDDQVMVYGDTYYGSWLNLYMTRQTQYRSVETWMKILEEILSYDVVAFLSGRTQPLLGYDVIIDVIGNFKDDIKSIFNQTLKCINNGYTLDKTVSQVCMDEKYRNIDYSQEYYGIIELFVESVYLEYLDCDQGDFAYLMSHPEKNIFQILSCDEIKNHHVQIRFASKNDLKDIIIIEQRCFPKQEAASKEEFIQRFEAFPRNFLVAVIDSKVIGFINGCTTDLTKLEDELYHDVTLHNESGDYMSVFGLDVDIDYQHQGIASLLMKAYIELANRRHKKGVILTCKKSLIGFYESFGYVCQGISSSSHGGAIWYDMIYLFNQKS